MKHIHIPGICGTFMGSLALLAKAKGFHVTGSDTNIYPPMSTLLEKHKLVIYDSFDPAHLNPAPDLIVVGNALSRGNPEIEHMLNAGLPYTSGPAFLAEHILKDKWVLAVAGTHGKTTTAAMLAWILDYTKKAPGFLIGGIPLNFGVPSRLGETDFFVIEADEYDTAFFDKRSKFIHYHPKTTVINNLEFDHADIFDDLKSIQKQLHHLIRTLPANGLIIVPENDTAISETLSMGRWTPVEKIGEKGRWKAQLTESDGSSFTVLWDNEVQGSINWQLTGEHNVQNALSAVAAACHAGIQPALACEALTSFAGIKRRMELLAEIKGVRIYDDFAHHPTAIAVTLNGWRQHVGDIRRIFAVIEPGSNTMKQGIHQHTLADTVNQADEVIWFEPDGLCWSLEQVARSSSVPSSVFHHTSDIINYLLETTQPGDDVIIMSNSDFNNLHNQLIKLLQTHTN